MVHRSGEVIFANAQLEDALGSSRRTLVGAPFANFLNDATSFIAALNGAGDHTFAALRYDDSLKGLERWVKIHFQCTSS